MSRLDSYDSTSLSQRTDRRAEEEIFVILETYEYTRQSQTIDRRADNATKYTSCTENYDSTRRQTAERRRTYLLSPKRESTRLSQRTDRWSEGAKYYISCSENYQSVVYNFKYNKLFWKFTATDTETRTGSNYNSVRVPVRKSRSDMLHKHLNI